jgi:hypothetical protein
MKEALIVAIIFGSLVLIPAVIGGTIVISIKLLKVEALETILLDREKGDRKYEESI